LHNHLQARAGGHVAPDPASQDVLDAIRGFAVREHRHRDVRVDGADLLQLASDLHGFGLVRVAPAGAQNHQAGRHRLVVGLPLREARVGFEAVAGVGKAERGQKALAHKAAPVDHNNGPLLAGGAAASQRWVCS
jgi:hypothetical protein